MFKSVLRGLSMFLLAYGFLAVGVQAQFNAEEFPKQIYVPIYSLEQIQDLYQLHESGVLPSDEVIEWIDTGFVSSMAKAFDMSKQNASDFTQWLKEDGRYTPGEAFEGKECPEVPFKGCIRAAHEIWQQLKTSN